jgi:hypothetical protein
LKLDWSWRRSSPAAGPNFLNINFVPTQLNNAALKSIRFLF